MFVRRVGVFVLHDFCKVVRIIVANRRIERGRPDRRSAQLRHARGGDAELFAQLFVGWFPTENFLQAHRGATHLGNFVDQVHGQTNRFRLVRQRALDGLFDPPRAVG